jgi:hypothetical protein
MSNVNALKCGRNFYELFCCSRWELKGQTDKKKPLTGIAADLKPMKMGNE